MGGLFLPAVEPRCSGCGYLHQPAPCEHDVAGGPGCRLLVLVHPVSGGILLAREEGEEGGCECRFEESHSRSQGAFAVRAVHLHVVFEKKIHDELGWMLVWSSSTSIERGCQTLAQCLHIGSQGR